MTTLRVALAQLPNRVGDIDGNVERISDAMAWAEQEAGADVLVLPELVLTGYPLGDLVLHEEFVAEATDALRVLAGRAGRTTAIVSTVERLAPQRSWDTRERDVAIAATLLCDGEVRGRYHKMLLPVYDVFDEARNYRPGNRDDLVWRIGSVVAGVAICEDLWSPDGPPETQSAAGAQILFVPNASPFHRRKAEGRLHNAAAVAVRNGLPVVYANFSGGQDELVFDGGSIVVDADGTLLARGAEFRDDRFVVDVPVGADRPVRGKLTTVHTRPLPDRAPATPPTPRPSMDDVEAVWHALVLAVRDHTNRNEFVGAVVGISGGIDSTVSAAIAVDALGPERVLGVFMPGPDSLPDEQTDAQALAENLGIAFEVIPVEAPSDADDVPRDAAPLVDANAARRRQRRFARARAAVLTDIFDERGYLVLTTGNKTEISIGHGGVLGSLTGGFAPLKDCPKTLLYDLARYRNELSPACPPGVFTRETTAQLTTFDGLPPYEVLDEIVERYVEHFASLADLVEAGFDPDLAAEVLRRIDDAEFTRRYTPPGVKLTARAFDQDRRMPLTSSWQAHRRRRRASAGGQGDQRPEPQHEPEPLAPAKALAEHEHGQPDGHGW